MVIDSTASSLSSRSLYSLVLDTDSKQEICGALEVLICFIFSWGSFSCVDCYKSAFSDDSTFFLISLSYKRGILCFFLNDSKSLLSYTGG